MLAAFLATAILPQNSPPLPSMQCLREVAAISSEPFDPHNAIMVDLVTAKFVNIWASATEHLTVEAEAIESSRELLRDWQAKQTERGAPPEAYEAVRTQMVQELQAYSAGDALRLVHGLAPGCVWPAVPPSVADRLS